MGDVPEIDGFSGLTLIGRGASGTVYRARQNTMSRNVAIKVLQASTTDPHARERFAREVRALGELSGHPSIVTTYTSGVTDDDRPYLVMDLMEFDISGLAPASIPEAVEMIIDAAEGLGEAHRRGILHRDIKPANIFVDRYQQVRLGDFGLVGLREAQSITNASVGSPAYMAPELLANARATVSSDLYALAVTLYWLVEASLPFEAGDAGVAGLFHAILSNPHRAPERMGSHLSQFVDRCLSKDPEQRPQSANDFIRELNDAVDEDEATVSPVAPVTPVAPTHSVPGLGSTSDPSSVTSALAPGWPPAAPPPPVTSGPTAPIGFAAAPPAPPQPPGSTSGGSSSGPFPPPAFTSGPHGRRSRGPWIAAGVVAVVALVAGGAFVALQSGGGADEPEAGEVSGVARIRSTAFAIPEGEEDPVEAVDEASGFLIDGGYIVTELVPAVADEVTVTFDGEEVDADLVGMAECRNVSVLQIDEDDVEGRHVFEWSTARIGFGNNLRLLGYDDDHDFQDHEVEVVSEPAPGTTGRAIHDIRFDLDVVVPPHTLGGPVLDRDGAVAGFAVSVDEAAEVSHAVGVDEMQEVVEDIIDTDGDIQGLGVVFREAGGAIGVSAVRPGSLAEEVGLEPGDEIVDIDDLGLAIADDPLADYCEATTDIGDREIPLRVRRDQSILVGSVNGGELEVESSTELEYQEVASDDNTLVVDIPASWEVFDDPATADYEGAVLSAQGPEGFLEYSVQPNRAPQDIVDIFVGIFADDPDCTVGETVEYSDGVFTGLETPVTCSDEPDAIAKLIAATEDSSGTAIGLLYSYDGPAAEEVSSRVEFSFLLPGA